MLARATTWALDASPLINLLATGRFGEILAATGVRFTAVTKVIKETLHPVDPDPLRRFLDDGTLTQGELSPAAAEIFVDLVSAGTVDDLDDGEAATIAHANDLGLGVVIDERKGRKVCASKFPSIPVVSTVALLRSEGVVAALGHEGIRRATFDALQVARMRVLPEDEVWVRTILDGPMLEQCTSLRTGARRPSAR